MGPPMPHTPRPPASPIGPFGPLELSRLNTCIALSEIPRHPINGEHEGGVNVSPCIQTSARAEIEIVLSPAHVGPGELHRLDA